MRHWLYAAALATGACTTAPAPPPATAGQPVAVARGCETEVAALHFDFEGASQSACAIEGDNAFAVLVTPEHAPPINPSPWFAFRYEATRDVVVTLRYLGGKHRYRPVLTDADGAQPVEAVVSEDGGAATLRLPPGSATVSGQPLYGSDAYAQFFEDFLARSNTRRLALGTSHEGRPISALHAGDPAAPRLIVLLGRAHPPEITGAWPFAPFLATLLSAMERDPALRARYQVIAVPLLNPDGVARGHWRANLGGKDLNRDWGEFSQPETRAVKRWLGGIAAGVEPVLMIDFHSTHRNLFYVQGEEATPEQALFLDDWLGAVAIPGYEFTLERSNANPGSGTSKNWFHATYGIPAYTYEVGDKTRREDAETAARAFAERLFPALERLP